MTMAKMKDLVGKGRRTRCRRCGGEILPGEPYTVSGGPRHVRCPEAEAR